jgi:hypothetical protein
VICATNACTTISFLKKDKARVGRSLVQVSKNVFVRVMNPSADTQIFYPGTIVAQVSSLQEVVNPNSKIGEEGELRTDLMVNNFVNILCYHCYKGN